MKRGFVTLLIFLGMSISLNAGPGVPRPIMTGGTNEHQNCIYIQWPLIWIAPCK